MPQVVSANAAQAATLQEQAAMFQRYAAGVSADVAARYAFWAALKREAARNNVNLSDVVPAAVIAANDAADRNAVRWATAVVALDRGQAELVGWTPDNGASLKLGVAIKGTVPRTLGAWPIVPIIYYGAIALASVGVWLLSDAWLDSQAIDADARRIHAQTQQAATEAIAKASAYSPEAGKAVADAIAQANASAQQPAQGVLANIAEAIRTATEAAGSMVKAGGGLGGFALLLLGLAWAGSRGRRGSA
jgi:hypothetical protein